MKVSLGEETEPMSAVPIHPLPSVAPTLRAYSELVAPPPGETARLLAILGSTLAGAIAAIGAPIERIATGSKIRGTAIKGLGGLDVLLVADQDAWNADSGVAVQALVSRLKGSLQVPVWPTRLGAFVQVQGDEAGIVLIPAHRATAELGPGFLSIPDGRGAWMATSPAAQAHYLAGCHRTAGRSLSDVARLLRTWVLLRGAGGTDRLVPYGRAGRIFGRVRPGHRSFRLSVRRLCGPRPCSRVRRRGAPPDLPSGSPGPVRRRHPG
jgi:hypothetical protein